MIDIHPQAFYPARGHVFLWVEYLDGISVMVEGEGLVYSVISGDHFYRKNGNLYAHRAFDVKTPSGEQNAVEDLIPILDPCPSRDMRVEKRKPQLSRLYGIEAVLTVCAP